MTDADLDAYARALAAYYAPHLDAGHLDHQAVHWGSAWGQRVRFDALTGGLWPIEGTLLDLGCGLAHLADYLDERGSTATYIGADLLPAMVDRARDRRPELDLRVLAPGAPLPDCDVAVASGIFATAAPEVLRHTVTAMWAAARRAISFNVLRSGAAQLEPGERAYSPAELIAWIEPLSPRWLLRTDHHPNDLSVTVWRAR